MSRPYETRPVFVLLLVASLATHALAGCARSRLDVEVSSGAEQRDPRGVVFREHRVAGLRVLETIVGGEAPLEAALPVVVQLHGRGDRVRLPGQDFGGLHQPVRLLLPEAPSPFGDGFTWSPVSITENRPHELAEALRTHADTLDRVLAWVTASRRVIGRPVVSGFSQGGMLSYTLAVRHPRRIGSAIPVAGWLPPELLPRRLGSRRELPPVDAVHGVDDPIVRIGPTRRTVRRLRQLGFAVTFEELSGVRHLWNDALAASWSARLERAVARERARASFGSTLLALGVP